jgi:hypothetical protein
MALKSRVLRRIRLTLERPVERCRTAKREELEPIDELLIQPSTRWWDGLVL